ncbi:DUF5708 family protein [Streptomyces sp. NPDC004783]|uniref:DUF5708 family protein n=1 Tax=Streptomyces sp. NPDC004783 TaxID=3154459 RepID=UPI0033A52B55
MRFLAERHLWEGAAAFLAGLALWLYTGGVEVPAVELPKVGAVLMCTGGAQTGWGVYRSARRRADRRRALPGGPAGPGVSDRP